MIRGNESVDIIRRSSAGSVDAYGNPTFSNTTVTIDGVLVANGSTNEPVDASRTPVDASLTVFLPAGSTITDGDILVIRGEEWVKDGDAQEWPQLWAGFTPGVVLNVRRRRG